jgi:thiol-disulfide isomerase/thioredoxin
MGTWCEDSQREVPSFFKIIDALEANDQVQPIVGLNEDKVSHDGSAEQAGVTNVPTFVFSKDGEEINQIVEFPIISLEQDILDILQEKGYKHAYDF